MYSHEFQMPGGTGQEKRQKSYKQYIMKPFIFVHLPRNQLGNLFSQILILGKRKIVVLSFVSVCGGEKCCTVTIFWGWGAKSAVLSHFSVLGKANMLYSHNFLKLGGEKCCTVTIFQAGETKSVVLSQFFRSGTKNDVLSRIPNVRGHGKRKKGKSHVSNI